MNLLLNIFPAINNVEGVLLSTKESLDMPIGSDVPQPVLFTPLFGFLVGNSNAGENRPFVTTTGNEATLVANDSVVDDFGKPLDGLINELFVGQVSQGADRQFDGLEFNFGDKPNGTDMVSEMSVKQGPNLQLSKALIPGIQAKIPSEIDQVSLNSPVSEGELSNIDDLFAKLNATEFAINNTKSEMSADEVERLLPFDKLPVNRLWFNQTVKHIAAERIYDNDTTNRSTAVPNTTVVDDTLEPQPLILGVTDTDTAEMTVTLPREKVLVQDGKTIQPPTITQPISIETLPEGITASAPKPAKDGQSSHIESEDVIETEKQSLTEEGGNSAAQKLKAGRAFGQVNGGHEYSKSGGNKNNTMNSEPGQTTGALNSSANAVNNQSTSETARTQAAIARFELPEDIKGSLQPNGKSVTIKIQPEHLGPAKLSLSLAGERVRARVVVNSHQAKAVLEGSIDQLKESLSKAHIAVDKIEITVSDDRNGQEWRDRQLNWNRRPIPLRNRQEEEFTIETEKVLTMALPQQVYQLGAAGVNLLA